MTSGAFCFRGSLCTLDHFSLSVFPTPVCRLHDVKDFSISSAISLLLGTLCGMHEIFDKYFIVV